MTWNDVLIQIIEGMLSLVIGVIGVYLTMLIKTKVQNDTLRDVLSDAKETVFSCVLKVKQTFVDNLKADGAFDDEAKKKAFQDCYNDCLLMLNTRTKEIIEKHYGDLETYLTTLIESAVADSKTNNG